MSLSFLWVAMLGTVLAMHRNEHLRLTLVVERLPRPGAAPCRHGAGGVAWPLLLMACRRRWSTHATRWPSARRARHAQRLARVGHRGGRGGRGRCWLVVVLAQRTVRWRRLLAAWWWWRRWRAAAGCRPRLATLGITNLAIFLVGVVVAGPGRRRAHRFLLRAGHAGYLGFATTVPLTVVVSRMDEGMSSIMLVSVPVFVLLGCVLDSTGMGKAIVDVLASLLGPSARA